MKFKNVLMMIDIQNDFCPGGSLAVPNGDAIVKLANQLQPNFDLVVASLDWHPQDHISFASNNVGSKLGDVVMANDISQTLWPDHCIQNTWGAEFHSDLDVARIDKIFYKGVDRTIDSYSAFYDNAGLRSTGLINYLHENNVGDVYILGLATDFCVKNTCIDAARSGFKTHLILDACRGIDLNKGDIDKALVEMQQHGVILMQSGQLFCEVL